MKYPGRVMGLDIGEVRTGVAFSDAMQCIATPSSVIQVKNPEQDITAINNLIEENDAVGIIVGLPYNLKGEIGPQAEKVLRFVEHMRTNLDIDIEMQDERMTTAVGQRVLRDAKVKNKKRKQVIDQMAAAQILQSWLDRESYRRKSEA